jgi:hypothetical protein
MLARWLGATGILTTALLCAAPVASEAQTLSGLVTSIDAAPMEGVLVSAKKQGSTITVTVVTGQDGRYSFPAGNWTLGTIC